MSVPLLLIVSATAAAFFGGFVSHGAMAISPRPLRPLPVLILAVVVWAIETWFSLCLLSLGTFAAFGYGALAGRWLEGYREPAPLVLAALALAAVPATWIWPFAFGLWGGEPRAMLLTSMFQDSFFLLFSRVLALFSLMALVLGTVELEVARVSTLGRMLLAALAFGALATAELWLGSTRMSHGASDTWWLGLSEVASDVVLLLAHVGLTFVLLWLARRHLISATGSSRPPAVSKG